MITDCIEDRIYLAKHPSTPVIENRRPEMMNLGARIPTVDEVRDATTHYYDGPLKTKILWHGSL